MKSKSLPTSRKMKNKEPADKQTDPEKVEMTGLGAFVDNVNDDYYFEDPSTIGI